MSESTTFPGFRTANLERLREIEEGLKVRFQEVEKDLQTWDVLFAFLERKMDSDQKRSELISEQLNELRSLRYVSTPNDQTNRVNRFAKFSIADAAATVLEEAGNPLHAKEIWQALENGGIVSNAKRPLNSLYALLLNDKRFIALGANRWKLSR
jgi:hypothetical protein